MIDVQHRNRRRLLPVPAASAVGMSATGSVAAGSQNDEKQPYRQPDSSSISASGDVTETLTDGFRISPLDDIGYQTVAEDDHVSAAGILDVILSRR